MAGNIQFNEPRYAGAPAASSPIRQSWLTKLVLKTGLARDAAGAQKVLLIILALAVLGIIGIWVFGGTGGSANVAPPPTSIPSA